jgi:hypothetical protein
MRSVFVQWPLLVRRGEGLLTDLRQHTPIDTLELSDFTFDWAHSELAAGADAPGALALPSTGHFDDLPFPVPVAEPDEYEGMAQAIAKVSAAGFKVACNVTPLYVSSAQAARFGCVDAQGQRIPCIRSNLEVYGCPSHPEVVAYAEAMARAFIAAWPVLDVLTINHAEYPLWPQQRPEELLVCFCDACRARAGERGLDLDRVSAELTALAQRVSESGSMSELRDAPLASWLQFRRDTVSECVERVIEAAREEAAAAGKTVAIGLEFQLPVLAPLIGTDFERLAGRLDFLVAKFPDYLTAAVLPGLVESLSGTENAELIALVRGLLGVGPGPREYTPAADPNEGIHYGNAFDPAVFDLQLPRLREVWGNLPVHAYLWKYGGDHADLRAKVGAVQALGFDGYFMWMWNRDLDVGGPGAWSLPRPDREGVL